MLRACLCGTATIVAREVDNAIRIADVEPVPDGPLVLLGDLEDQPLALWGTEPGVEERLPWGIVVPADAKRYRQHECP